MSDSSLTWIDNPDENMQYLNHTKAVLVEKYLRFSALPLLKPQDVTTTVLQNMLAKQQIDSFATRKTREGQSMFLVRMAVPNQDLDVAPLLELVVPVSKKEPVTFRFQVSTTGWTPIPGTSVLFEENKLLTSAAHFKDGVRLARGKHVMFKMNDLSFEFYDAETLELLAKHGQDTKSNTTDEFKCTLSNSNMKVPRLRGHRMHIAVAFRQTLANMQHSGFFARFNLVQLVQWLCKCISQWSIQYAKSTLSAHVVSRPLSVVQTNLLSIPPPKPNSSRQKVHSVFETPSHWSLSLNPREVERVCVDSGSHEFDTVARFVKSDSSAIECQEVFRIQNGAQWDRYQLAIRQHKLYPHCEKWLFHGTPEENVASIVATSFETRLCQESNLWGKGAHFTTRPGVALQSAKPDKDGVCCMFVARVFVGHHTTTTDDCQPPLVFVTNDNSHAYPAYLVKFKHTK